MDCQVILAKFPIRFDKRFCYLVANRFHDFYRDDLIKIRFFT